jgi:hypothetical protein
LDTALTVLAIQQFAHRLAAGFVRLFRILVLGAARAATGRGIGSVRLTALRATVGKAGLVRLKLKLLRADNADFNGKGHADFRIQRAGKVLCGKKGPIRSGFWLGLEFGLTVLQFNGIFHGLAAIFFLQLRGLLLHELLERVQVGGAFFAGFLPCVGKRLK